MPVCMQVNFDILEFLASGPATLEQLHAGFFIHPSGKPKSRQSFEKKMDWLLEREYIRAMKYPSGWVYILGEAGIGEVCMIMRYEPDYIRARQRFPGGLHLEHELNLSDIMRKIIKDAGLGLYKLSYCYDDKVMKFQMAEGKRFKKDVSLFEGITFPDLKIGLGLEEPIEVALEYDNEKKQVSYFKDKVSDWDLFTIIICKTHGRCLKLKKGLSGKVKPKVSIGTLEDFSKHGILNHLAVVKRPVLDFL